MTDDTTRDLDWLFPWEFAVLKAADFDLNRVPGKQRDDVRRWLRKRGIQLVQPERVAWTA